MQAIVKVALYPLHTCLDFMNVHVSFDLFLQFTTTTNFTANMAMVLLHMFSQIFFIYKVLVTSRLTTNNLYICCSCRQETFAINKRITTLLTRGKCFRHLKEPYLTVCTRATKIWWSKYESLYTINANVMTMILFWNITWWQVYQADNGTRAAIHFTQNLIRIKKFLRNGLQIRSYRMINTSSKLSRNWRSSKTKKEEVSLPRMTERNSIH